MTFGSNMSKNFKPFVGRCFELKAITSLAKYPPVALVLDEKEKDVLILDKSGIGTWIKKSFLRNEPMPSPFFATEVTLTKAMSLIEELRTIVQQQDVDERLNKRCSMVIGELRSLDEAVKKQSLFTS